MKGSASVFFVPAMPKEEVNMDRSAVIAARIEDKIEQCRRGFYTVATGFLDLHEQSLAAQAVKRNGDLVARWEGGYDDAERRILLLSPRELSEVASVTESAEEWIRVLRVSAREGERRLTHRDYLGAVLGLGIERSVIGDILVRPGGADLLVREEITPFLLSEFHSAGHTHLTPELCPLSELIVPAQRKEAIRDTLSSLRLDNVIAAAFGLSRAESLKAIRSGLVAVDHEEVLKADRRVEEGAVLVLRGRGKAVLNEVGGTSRKGRVWVEFQRYR